MEGLIGGTAGINPSTYENLVSIMNDCNQCTPAAVALLATLTRSLSSMPRNRPNFDRHVYISEIPDPADVEASRSTIIERIDIEMIKASTAMEQLTGVELSAPLVSPQQMMLQACIKTAQMAITQHEVEAQHCAVNETKRATRAFLKRAKLVLSKATSEKLKAKSSLNQLLGSPNKQFVEYQKVDLTKAQPAVGTNGLPDDEAAQVDKDLVVRDLNKGPSMPFPKDDRFDDVPLQRARFGLMMPKERPSPVRSQPVSTPAIELSPEQRSRINENKAKAMARNVKRQRLVPE